MAYISKLSIKNFMKIRQVEIRPDGKEVRITGKNASGKSTVINSILSLTSWTDAKKLIERPIHYGETSASVEAEISEVAELGDLVVTRTWTTNESSYLKVATKDGKKLPSPQSIVERLFGSAAAMAFNPVESAKAPEEELTKLILQVVKLPRRPEEFDQEKASLYNERTLVNRQVTQAKARLAAMKAPPADTPAEEVRAGTVLQQIQEAQAVMRQQSQFRAKHEDNRRSLENLMTDKGRILEQIEDLHLELEEIEKERLNLNSQILQEDKEIETFVDPNLEAYSAKLQNIEDTNRQIREAHNYRAMSAQVDEKQRESDALTAKMEEVDFNKSRMLSSVKIPVKGLSFDGQRFNYQGLPLSQSSESEKMRIAVGLLISLNPELRIVFFPNNSFNLLDAEHKTQLLKVLDQYKLQAWIESNDDPDGNCIVIEDGVLADPKVKEFAPIMDGKMVTARNS